MCRGQKPRSETADGRCPVERGTTIEAQKQQLGVRELEGRLSATVTALTMPMSSAQRSARPLACRG